MPQPSVRDGEEHYAGIEGQVVWEGEVLDKYVLYKGQSGGWVAVWKGEVHIGKFRTYLSSRPLLISSIRENEYPGSCTGIDCVCNSARCASASGSQAG